MPYFSDFQSAENLNLSIKNQHLTSEPSPRKIVPEDEDLNYFDQQILGDNGEKSASKEPQKNVFLSSEDLNDLNYFDKVRSAQQPLIEISYN